MVNTDIPKHYTASPSSISGTPQLTINREVTVDLDSTNVFEGPEKLLEVWFSASPATLPASTPPNGLKVVPSEMWKDMLDLVNCKVLSVVESDHVDAYLLSESSMFVFPHKLILKTCGTTTLLAGLPRILEIAATAAGFPQISPKGNPVRGVPIAASPYRVFYSRKNFLFPDRQHGPHRSWRDEVKTLDRLFLGGSAYMIGKMNGEHWYLYLTEPNTRLTPPASPLRADTETKVLELPAVSRAALGVDPPADSLDDETLEVLMTDLDENNAKQFYLDHASAVAEGRFLQRSREAKRDATDHLATIKGYEVANLKVNGTSHVGKKHYNQDAVDIFSNTSSENGEFSSDEEDCFPEELTTEGHALGTVVSESSGLVDVYPPSKYPDARIDAYLFTPCGFSANGVVPAPDAGAGGKATHYFTVHVTPEAHCSYASFESNVPSRQTGRETAEVIEQVVSIFRPGRFSVTLFETKPSFREAGGDLGVLAEIKAVERQAARRNLRMDSVGGYRRVERIVHDLEGYDLVFRYYERDDWEGGAPRLGEACF
ncbi:MAG: s-adenosylmethionine decarboxylase proenzyme [Lasallia pustulata]|uniref:adenosylmethionine decarboxylase n=1 Tax=Lasallia pustulata TaxID=136370 RepID=A0A5M8PW12_9LECA|nr:MAG: s-adenosylmethionine decarboxylase proenzyme [Lasallia pustulata]